VDVLHHITERTTLRELATTDAAFVLELLNEPAFRNGVGDRGVRTLEQAAAYIEDGPRASYAEHGYGLLLVERRSDHEALGICGLVRRPGLDGPDLGFALLERHARSGYATEAAKAVLEAARRHQPPFGPLLAIAGPKNVRSIRLLEALDFRFERLIALEPGEADLALFTWEPLAEARAAADAAPDGEYVCPSCGERIVVPIDVGGGVAQEFVEDCPVCCSPNVVHVHLEDDGPAAVTAHAE
jgi:RimJ/RimL family protein N-acetyltransferase